MIGTFSQGILGDIYNRQMYIGGEDYQNKLLTRREIVALVNSVAAGLDVKVAKLIDNADILNKLADNSSDIYKVINKSYSIAFSNGTLSLYSFQTGDSSNKTLISSTPINVQNVNVYDLCNIFDLDSFYI